MLGDEKLAAAVTFRLGIYFRGRAVRQKAFDPLKNGTTLLQTLRTGTFRGLLLGITGVPRRLAKARCLPRPEQNTPARSKNDDTQVL